MQFAEKIVDAALRSTGSTWITQADLEAWMASSNTGTMNDIIYGVHDGFLVSHKMDDGNTAYSTRHFHIAENQIAENILRLQYVITSKQFQESLIDTLIDAFETEENDGRKLHFHQRDAVKMVCNNNVSVLTGGPGTGKTTVLSAITYCLRRLNDQVRIVFTAPTGKAAKRIVESTGEHASTVHKKFGIKTENSCISTFYEDALFIDESSMNDTDLVAKILSYIPDGRKVVFVGDTAQLPSVGPGAVLRDFILSGVLPVTKLTHTFRQDNNSTLHGNICNIRDGVPEFINGDDFHAILLPQGDQKRAACIHVRDVYLDQIQKYGSDEVVVLIPYRRSGFCSNIMNNYLQKLVNKETSGYRYYNSNEKITIFFKENDFVMQLINRDECANGDVGKVILVSNKGIKVQYSDCEVSYSPNELSQLALAYSMTIHKSQGSEYKSVIMCFLDEHERMLQRNLLYTGITRAKKECTVIYQQHALEVACKTIADANRLTMLSEKLRALRMQYKMLYGV